MKALRNLQHSLRRQAASGVFHALHQCATRSTATGRRAIIVPPGAAGSLGDEAMFFGLLAMLENAGFEHITVASLSGPVPAHYLSSEKVKSVELRGYTSRLFAFAALAREHTHCFIIGADVMDGFYSLEATRVRCHLATLAAVRGLETAVTGFSLRTDVPAASVRDLGQTDRRVRFLLRDEISLERFQKLFPGRGELVADLAFMLQPIADTDCVAKTRAWCAAEHARGRIVLGVNANYLLVEKIAANADECVRVYAELLDALSAKHPEFSLLLIPHDLRRAREKVSDLDLCRMIAAKIPEPLRANSYVVEDCRFAGEIKELVTFADLVFTGRMHLAIACHGRGVPAAAVVYQGKFEGFYRHFGLTGLQIEPGDLAKLEVSIPWLSAHLAAHRELRAKISARLPEVLALSQLNVSQPVPA